MKIGEILFGGPQTEKQFRGNDFKKVVINSEIFPRKWRNFWCTWSANRDKTCQVVRELEKVENRCCI